MNNRFTFTKLGSMALLLLSLSSCNKDYFNGDNPFNSGKDKTDITFYALAGGTVIDKLNSANNGVVLNSATLTGLQPSETILAMDFRPATGQLYGLSSQSRLYVINPITGNSRIIGTGPITPDVSCTGVGFDFNPTVDRIRVVTSAGQNVRLNPETGTIAATDLAINGVPGAMVNGVAYTNNVAGAATTTLYDIDVVTQKLYKQTPPNDGKLVAVGDLKLKISGEGGFDISPVDSIALGMYLVNNTPTLFRVNLSTGEAKTLVKYDKNKAYMAIAIPTLPVAYAVDATTNSLLILNPTILTNIVPKPITGLMLGEKVVGMDFRPLNGQLYALTSNSRIITLNASSGVAAIVGSLSTPLQGSAFGFDFNPVVDRIRIVSNTGQNLRYNQTDPSLPTIVDGNLNPGVPAIQAVAYANNFAGAATTTLFAIDVNTDKLYIQNPPNNGTLTEVGKLNYNIDQANGFDIGGTSGLAYAVLTAANKTKLYLISTTTGAAVPTFDFPGQVNGFTVGLGF